MTIADRWLLPDGIEEVLPFEANQIEWVRNRALAQFKLWGYEFVIPPAAEYLDSLLTGTGHDLELMTFKITDQYSGRLMGLPADITQQVARMDAHSMPKEQAARYCYANQVLRTKPSSLLSNRCPLQLGAELFGSAHVHADVEVVNLMLATVSAIGFDAITLDLGHVAIFRTLVDVWQLDENDQSVLRSILQRKSTPEFNEWLANSALSDQQIKQAKAFFSLSGSTKVLAQAKDALSGIRSEIDDAIEQLIAVTDAVTKSAVDVAIHIDLSELRGYDYHTGLVFAAFVNGVGKSIAKGGRYDETGKVFGRSRPATGFSMDARFVASLVVGSAEVTPMVFAPNILDLQLQSAIQSLRASGTPVVVALSDVDSKESLSCTDELVQDTTGNWILSSQIMRA